MEDTAAVLIACSALVLLVLGLAHLLLTFRGSKLHPRDHALLISMQEKSPNITRQTTMWRAWIGFNASHSYGAILFGLTWPYLALLQPQLLFASWYLLSLGLVFLLAWLLLARRYWFVTPLLGTLLATALYATGLVLLVA